MGKICLKMGGKLLEKRDVGFYTSKSLDERK